MKSGSSMNAKYYWRLTTYSGKAHVVGIYIS